jgi:hypothetical protein
MPANERSGLKAAFTNFNRQGREAEAELKLLGRTVEDPSTAETVAQLPGSYQQDTVIPAPPPPSPSGLIPRPLGQREAVRQLSFRCPVSLAGELRKKAAYNQLEQQQIITEGIRRVLSELPDPPIDWTEY